MQIQATSRTINEIKYESENSRMTVEDFHLISKDMKTRKVPAHAAITLGTARTMTVRF